MASEAMASEGGLRPSQEESWTRTLRSIQSDKKVILENRKRYPYHEYDHAPVYKTWEALSRACDKEIDHLSQSYCMIEFVPEEMLVLVLQQLDYKDLLRTKVWAVSKQFRHIFDVYFKADAQKRFYAMRQACRESHDYNCLLRRVARDWPSFSFSSDKCAFCGCSRPSPAIYPRCAKCDKPFGCLECHRKHEDRCKGKKPVCAMCGAPSHFRCSGCHQEPYCGRRCQAKHWKLCHREGCKK